MFARLDSARSCEDRKAPVFPPSGELVTYHRCTRCGFIFCPDFDALSDAEMAELIYNDDYIRADPGFADERPRYFAKALISLFAGLPRDVRALDFGGGKGLLAQLLRASGSMDCYDSYDPYFDTGRVPNSTYDIVTAFEVMEHSRDPLGTFRAARACLKPCGVLLFSTQLQPPRVDAGWWYIAPRNGHFSIYSHASLRRLGRRLGMRTLSLNEGLHMMYAAEAAPLARAIARNRSGAVLWCASRCGPTAWASAVASLARLGFVMPALNPRHLVRMLALSLRPG